MIIDIFSTTTIIIIITTAIYPLGSSPGADRGGPRTVASRPPGAAGRLCKAG